MTSVAAAWPCTVIGGADRAAELDARRAIDQGARSGHGAITVSVPTAMLDHLVVAADTLDQGAAYVRDRLGVSPAGGGTHVAMGTHNRVLKLGRGSIP